jgi:hypothetical protein
MNSIINNEINVDVTDILGIIKYEKPIPDELKQSILGEIPSFIVKTDEERIQNLVDDFDEIKICTAYKDKRDGKIYKNYPTNVFIQKVLQACLNIF